MGDLRAKIEERVAVGENLLEASNKVSCFRLLQSQFFEAVTELWSTAGVVQGGRQGSRAA
jgi:hypothetical protein